MLPTYVLPYFGSNSVAMGVIGAAVGLGMTPMWWVHVWCLTMLALIASIRGKTNGKSYLLIFPTIGGLFDITPLLSIIPLVPTVMHLIAIVLGCIGQSTTAPAGSGNESTSQEASAIGGWENWMVWIVSSLAILGCVIFAMNAKRVAVVAPRPIQVQSRAAVQQPASEGVQRPITAPSISQPNDVDSMIAPPKRASESKKQTHMPARKPSEETKPTVRYIDINK